MPKLALLDGHSLAYRAFYALPSDLATPSGQVTNAVYGFTSMLIKLLGDESPDAIAVAWDVRGPTFRSEAYPEYKAQRDRAPDLFTGQLPLIDEVLTAMQISQLRIGGYEADDVLATVADRAREKGWDVIVVTGDRDAFQLIEPGVAVMYTRRGITDTIMADAGWIQERYGITPEQYVDYAALRGDTSDNLPGVPGVGEKTAAKLINAHGDVAGVIAAAPDFSPKLRDNVVASVDQITLNRDLMTLVRDVPIEFDLDEFSLDEFKEELIRPVFEDLAFRSLWDRLAELGGLEGAAVEVLEVDVVTVSDPERLMRLGSGGALTVAPVWEEEVLAGVVVAGDPATFVRSEDLDSLVSDAPGLVGHDVKALVRALTEMGIEPPSVVFDTALAAYVVNPAQRAPDLPALAGRELGIVLDDGEGEHERPQGAFDFEGPQGPDLAGAARRAVATEMLVGPMSRQLEARGGTALYEEIELPLVPILARMEIAGVGIDSDFLDRFGTDLRERLADLEQRIHGEAGAPFNINSTLQLREVLFDQLGLPVIKKTPKGAASTDASVLEKLRDEHPIVDDLLTYRELEKLRSTYVDALTRLVDDDGRIRGRFNQMAAATGRLSQEQPNLQNIPVRTEEGRAIRRAFTADEGNLLLVADYSQIELRILAHLSSDPGLMDAFHRDIDVHAATAARINRIDLDAVTPDQRRKAKMINFGLLYGMEAYGLAQRLDIDREEAQAHIDAYFAQFPEVQAYLHGVVEQATVEGYTTTLLGRRRYLPELASPRFRDRQAGERMALNAPIQGSAADIIKKAMIDLDGELAGRSAEMLLQIHDELVIEVPEDEVEEVAILTRDVMERIVDLTVPLKVDVGSGKTLADAKQ
ncbi:MAG: DNA polymerase I [Acidimicrobiia bacterium]|nr:MAG: DNA polymerase I [Acidimicrobiia bacterium]